MPFRREVNYPLIEIARKMEEEEEEMINLFYQRSVVVFNTVNSKAYDEYSTITTTDQWNMFLTTY